MMASNLCGEIQNAFAQVKPPDGYTDDLDTAALTEISATLEGMSEDAFYFFLPKVLCYLLTDEARQADVAWPDLVMSAINPLDVVPSGRRRKVEEKQLRLSRFSNPQVHVIIKWLQWIRDKEDWTGISVQYADALILYWRDVMKISKHQADNVDGGEQPHRSQ